MIYRYFSLAAFLLLVVVASLAGSSFEAGEWYYVTMRRPSMAPPGWLYAVIWALIYIFMAAAAWKIWLTEHYARLGALAWWVLLLVLNIAWSALFFGLHRPGWALPVLLLATGAAILCIRAFSRLSRPAAYLMVPYLGWVLFLLVLNLAIWTVNGGALAGFLS
ncbi:MAG: tryptophan-rich sensory protein [Xanthomonadales bacterium]|nr:tryptophan-rich sensory protein [Xanthomonadales bacterium]